MNDSLILIIGIESIALVAIAILAVKLTKKNKHFEERFSGVIDADKEVEKAKKEKEEATNDIESLRSSYKEKKVIHDRLLRQVAIYEDSIELAELGFYSPQFDFDASEKFKERIKQIKQTQKEMIAAKTAITCSTEWTVEGSKAKGRTMTNRGIRMTARAFNNECDSAISSVRWNNATRLIQRIEKAFDGINKLNESNRIFVSTDYLELKLEELRLTHEYKEKKQEEKEEKAELRQQQQDEAKLQKELEKAIKEEDKYNRLLTKAKEEAQKATGDKLELLISKIADLNKELEEAHQKSERAKSMAEQTRIGHVYIISNIGSFGEGIVKIGMTRRLDPFDRVKELGDASVPFIFDVHAIIYSEDAPSLENSLHKKFSDRRINMVNNRKEFFRISLDELEEELLTISPDTELVRKPEARQYKETQAIIRKKEEAVEVTEFPDEI
jgi:hypothetical protein